MLADLILAYQEKYKVSTRSLARLIGVSHFALARFLAGKEISAEHWKSIAKWALIGDN